METVQILLYTADIKYAFCIKLYNNNNNTHAIINNVICGIKNTFGRGRSINVNTLRVYIINYMPILYYIIRRSAIAIIITGGGTYGCVPAAICLHVEDHAERRPTTLLFMQQNEEYFSIL